MDIKASILHAAWCVRCLHKGVKDKGAEVVFNGNSLCLDCLKDITNIIRNEDEGELK